MEITKKIDMESVVWEECVSERGIKYEIGHVDKTDVSARNEKETSTNKQDFGASCDWAPSSSHSWKDTDSAFKGKTGISRYSVNENPGSTYTYIINFTNVENYSYYFFDETGDSYSCNTFRTGDHWVRYSSSKPKIVFVKGD